MNTATVEHMIPLSRGGTNEYWNLASACRRCNCMRGIMPADQFELVARRLVPDTRQVAEYELECRRRLRMDRKAAKAAFKRGDASHLTPGTRAHRYYLNRAHRMGIATQVTPAAWTWSWLQQHLRRIFAVDAAAFPATMHGQRKEQAA
jgi:hypothetical protein